MRQPVHIYIYRNIPLEKIESYIEFLEKTKKSVETLKIELTYQMLADEDTNKTLVKLLQVVRSDGVRIISDGYTTSENLRKDCFDYYEQLSPFLNHIRGEEISLNVLLLNFAPIIRIIKNNHNLKSFSIHKRPCCINSHEAVRCLA